MNKSKLAMEKLRVLGLDPREKRVLETLLAGGTLSVSDISRGGRVNRTTVYPALKRLQVRGLARGVIVGKRRHWKAANISKIKNALAVAKDYFKQFEPESPYSDMLDGIEAREAGVAIYRGKRQILRAYEMIFELSKTERVIGIQGNRSAREALKKFEPKLFYEFHKRFKEAHFIMEGINGERVLEILRRLTPAELRSHHGRMVISTLLPDAYMDFDVDVLVFRDTTIFINPKEEIAIFIRNKALVEMFNHVAEFLQDSGRRIDLNAHIDELIRAKTAASPKK